VIEPTAQGFTPVGRAGSVAIVTVSGVMTKNGSSLSAEGSTRMAKAAIRSAARDESISGIVLRMDTPGGTVSGTDEFAQAIKAAAQKKPVIGFVEDLCASAGVWTVSQCAEVYANSSTAQIGSIGTYLGLYDLSKMAEKEGIKPVLIKAGEFKGGGFPGTEISDAQIEKWQAMINATQAEFTHAVAAGRGMPQSQAESLVTGLTYMASEAQKLGLIDGIRNLEAVVEQLQKPLSGARQTMSAASFNDITSKCTGIDTAQAEDAMFVTDCQKKGLTVEAAQDAWSQTLISRAKSAREELAAKEQEITDLKARNTELEAELAKSKQAGTGLGVKSIGTKSGEGKAAGDADPNAEFNAEIAKKVAAGMTRQKAVLAINREQPELVKAVREAANSR
jgi:signal peptide peptidase SppA